MNARTRVVVVSIVVLAVVAGAASTYLIFPRAVRPASTISNNSGTASSLSSCLEEFPDTASIGPLDNSTFHGYVVTLSNGTRAFFPLDACLRPAPPESYRVASNVEANPRFIAAENGSLYGVEPFRLQPTAVEYTDSTTGCTTFSVFNDTSTHDCSAFIVLVFVRYSNQTFSPCGYSTFKKLGQIRVSIPLTPTAGLDYPRLTIQTIPSELLNHATCTTTVTTSSITTVCSVQVPPPQGTYLRVITDGAGAPVSGLQVTMRLEEVASCDRNNVKLTNSVAVTNSSGWILFRQGYPWDFVFTYSGYAYNFTVPGRPYSWTVATISVPSGKLSTKICGLGGGSPNSCEAASTTAVSTSPELQNATSTTTSAASVSSATCAGATAGTTCTASGSISSKVISLVVTASGSDSTTMHFDILMGEAIPRT